MLYGAFAESKAADGAPWIVELPEDNVQGMCILVDVIHGNLDKVPQSIKDHEIYRIHPENPCLRAYEFSIVLGHLAVAADKNDVVQLLYPWIDRWLDEGCRCAWVNKERLWWNEYMPIYDWNGSSI
jgi:hypothetical protein